MIVALVKAATMIQAGMIVCSYRHMNSSAKSLIDTVRGIKVLMSWDIFVLLTL